MHPNLDKYASLRRFQLRRIGFPALVLGFCALTQAALGQAQLGTAESCFDQGPDKLPAISVASIPPPPAALPTRLAQIGAPARVHAMKVSMEKPARPLRDATLNRSHWTPAAKSPEGTLTAAR
jgi:hypothetical protein